MTILLFILFFFIIFPVAYGAFKLWNLRRRMRNMQNDLFSQFFGTDTQRQRQPDHTAPRRKKKKKDPRVGEYINFTEISVEQQDTTTDNATTHFAAEEQISDIEWEDIK